MTPWFFVGGLAALLTMFGFVPQISRMYRTKSVADISVVTLLQFTFGVTLWALYGYSASDPILIVANIISLATLVVALGLYFHYRQIPRHDEISIKEG